MMKSEFEALAGYEVSFEDYSSIIEPMYMATNLSKQDFVKCIDKIRFALPTRRQMINKMKKEANHLFEICGRYTDYEAESRLEKLAKEFAARIYNLDWNRDTQAYVFFNRGYEYPDIQRGCTYPRELVIGRGNHEYERIQLVVAK